MASSERCVPSLRDRIDDWLMEQPYAAGTKEAYRWYLGRLADWLEEQGKDMATLTGAEFVRWLDTRQKTWGSASRNMAAASMKGFVRWSYGDSHPALRVRIKRESPGPQRTLTSAEAKTLLDYLEHGSNGDAWRPSFVRNLALVSLLLDTGLRATEVCDLKLENLDLPEGTLQVRIKGGRWGQGIFGERTRIRLEAWLELRKVFARPAVDTVFVGIGGLAPGTPLTGNGLRRLFHYMALDCGLKRISPHTLRRSFAVLSIENGASTRLVQLAGRWRSLMMVETYTRTLAPGAFAPFSPVEGIERTRKENPR